MFFSFGDGLCLIASTMPFKERVKAAMHGPIVVLKPIMRRQDKVNLVAEAMSLKNSDLCRSSINLRVLVLSIGLKLRRSNDTELRDFGNDKHSSEFQESASG